jgi:hypothetical protein
MKTPESIKSLTEYYKDKAWEDYNSYELGMWVHLLIKRSYHRAVKEKAEKDLIDAQNYLYMLQAHIEKAKENLKNF